MAITDIEIEDTFRVGAPSIKYEGKDTTPANPTLIAGPDRYQRILEDLINELEGQLGRELTDAEYDEVGKEAYDRFHSGDYAEGGSVGQATNSSSLSSSEDILPEECLPTASNTSTTVTSFPLNFPGKIDPP